MNWTKKLATALALALLALGAAGCMQSRDPSVNWRLSDSRANLPKLPEKLAIGKSGVPVLTVHDVSKDRNDDMDIETYVAGVVAGEMKNDWPMEALKAQAILARTFVLKFCQDKQSKYEGADISTDVAEAQAYAPDSVNARVRQAVNETRGMALSWQGEFPNAWFHAHSGGMTELPSVALEYKGGDPDYLRPTASVESDRAPAEAQRWTATFTREQVARACADAGTAVGAVETVELDEKGESGRAKAILVNGKAVSAPSFRIQIGANKLKSTLIDSVEVAQDRVIFRGRGFGHGVGLSQWGAYQMAEEGRTAPQILQKYFPSVGIVELW